YFVGRTLSTLDGSYFVSRIAIAARMVSLLEAAAILYTFLSGPVVEPYQALIIDPLTTGEGLARSAGTVGHPVVAAAVLIPGTIAWLEYALSIPNGVQKWLAYLVLGASGIAILLTFSRGAWFALAITLLLFALRKGYFLQWRSYIIGALVALFIGVSPLGTYAQVRLAMTDLNDPSVTHRLLMYGWVGERWVSSVHWFLIGSGLGTAKIAMADSPPADGMEVIDNAWLTMLIEVGLIGTLLILSVQVVPSFLRVLRRGTPHTWIPLSILALSIDGLTFDTFYWQQVAIVIWLLTGMLVTLNLAESMETVGFLKPSEASY
ncbi:MAG: O-antigen ligase family protein, partial [Syntrophomonadaceae bacterium]|nr:O-antigen ligase family protein [Syntrophomonadaceae bacterium]